MLAATKLSTIEGSVRRAKSDDTTALKRLLAGAGDARIPPAPDNHLLVLDIAGFVVAALRVACDGRQAHVQNFGTGYSPTQRPAGRHGITALPTRKPTDTYSFNPNDT